MPPTMREIATGCQLPLTTVFRHLDWLQARGHISRDDTARSIRPCKPLLTDEEQVYAGLVRAIKVNSLAPSLSSLHRACQMPASRVKAALYRLEQAGRVRPDPEDPRCFYPVETDG